MSPDDNRLISDKFPESTRYATVLVGVGVCVISLIIGLWFVAIIGLLIALACAFNRHRTIIDFESKLIRDERGVIGLSSFAELHFSDVDAIEVGYIDVEGRYGSQRYYKAKLIYRQISRKAFELETDTDLAKVSMSAKSFSERSQIPLRVSADLQKLKVELDNLTQSATQNDG